MQPEASLTARICAPRHAGAKGLPTNTEGCGCWGQEHGVSSSCIVIPLSHWTYFVGNSISYKKRTEISIRKGVFVIHTGALISTWRLKKQKICNIKRNRKINWVFKKKEIGLTKIFKVWTQQGFFWWHRPSNTNSLVISPWFAWKWNMDRRQRDTVPLGRKSHVCVWIPATH